MASTRRRRRWWTAGAVLGLCVGWAAFVASTLLGANRDVRSGLRAMEAAQDKADAEAIIEGRLLPELRTAGRRFASAHDAVGSPVLLPLRVLPVIGRQLRSVEALTRAATVVTDIAIAGITEAQPVLAGRGGDPAARAQHTRLLADVARRADMQLGDIELGPDEGLVPALARARDRLADEVGEVRATLAKATVGATALADILAGPRRYLLLAANNAEMRAGSGMFLSAGELESNGVSLKTNNVRTLTEIPVPQGTVPLTGDLADRWGWLAPNVEWRNLMTSPRFDVAAPLAAQMWVAAGNRPVDGVIAVDPVALRAVLSATGPVEADGRRIDETNVERELLHAQYERFPDFEDKPERREGLGMIAEAAFSALDRGSWSLPRLGSELARAASGRHLLVWSAHPAEQAAWRELGVDGTLGADSLLVSVLNRAGTKMDYFLHVNGRLAVRAIGEETEVVVTLDVENRVPTGQPRYVSGPVSRSGAGEGEYLGILTLNMPKAARQASVEGGRELAVLGSDGPTEVIGFQFKLPRGARESFVARFRLPAREGTLRIEPSARVPLIRWSTDAGSWTDTGPRLLTW
jgi:hypothetical protein